MVEVRQVHAEFLEKLFLELDNAGVRYCVLQRWDALMGEVATDHDIDISVPPAEVEKLRQALGALLRRGYRPIQLLNHAVNSYAIVFGWMDCGELMTVMVDVAFEHRQCGLIWRSAEELLAGRQRPGAFWVASAETELAYLLVKKVLKDNWSAARNSRFRVLAERLGRARAEQVIAELFGGKRRREIMHACLEGKPERAVRPLRRRFLARSMARNPFNVLRYAVQDGIRLARRWMRPTGAMLEAPNATLGRQVGLALGPAFGKITVYPDRPSWLLYWLRVRLLIARNGLVIVDASKPRRPFTPRPDLIIASKREIDGETVGAVLESLSRRFSRQYPDWAPIL